MNRFDTLREESEEEADVENSINDTEATLILDSMKNSVETCAETTNGKVNVSTNQNAIESNGLVNGLKEISNDEE